VNVYAVAGVNPVTVKLRLVVVVNSTPPRNTSYPVTPTASVDAFHVNVTDVAVNTAAANPVGAVGAVTSSLGAAVGASYVGRYTGRYFARNSTGVSDSGDHTSTSPRYARAACADPRRSPAHVS
jgi:hypothetical protein